MTDALKLLLKSLANFNEEQLHQVSLCFIPKTVKKNTIVLPEGTTCREFYYVHTGCIRTYFITTEGQEKTRYIMTDCTIGTALTSFISQKPSFELMEAVEDTDLMAISHADFYRLNEEMQPWQHFYRKMLEMAYTFQGRRIEGLVTLPAKQRYEQLLQENPALIQKVSNKVLASYLDIAPETLSRLKGR